jgi:hypothetical protein
LLDLKDLQGGQQTLLQGKQANVRRIFLVWVSPPLNPPYKEGRHAGGAYLHFPNRKFQLTELTQTSGA